MKKYTIGLEFDNGEKYAYRPLAIGVAKSIAKSIVRHYEKMGYNYTVSNCDFTIKFDDFKEVYGE